MGESRQRGDEGSGCVRTRFSPKFLAGLLAVAVSGSACTSGGGGETGPGYGGAEEQNPAGIEAEAADAADADAALGADLSVSEETVFEAVVVDANGFTLYRSDDDGSDPPESVCEDQCAQTWPPLRADGEITTEGLNDALVGTVQRSDGIEQVTLGGWPLYTYVGDAAPGDANGQDEGNPPSWFAIAPDGQPAAPAEDQPAGEQGDGAP